uniref:Uncharacterized protein n=1 Tax=Entamoeba invadens TaxID=33085 RepID=S0B4G6_ENTIV|nr:hypothetical protein [Entamoeba invadens]
MSELSCTPRTCNCVFCRMKETLLQNKYIPWITLARLVFLSLSSLNTNKRYFSVKTDIPEYIHSHWDLFKRLNQFNSSTRWKKSILDAINHSRFFESGKIELHSPGFWKLKDNTIPLLDSSEYSDQGEYVAKTNSPSVDSFYSQNVLKPECIECNSLEDYYTSSVTSAKQNIHSLLSLYTISDETRRKMIKEEISESEKSILRASQHLYKISLEDNSDNYNASACLLIRTVF